LGGLIDLPLYTVQSDQTRRSTRLPTQPQFARATDDFSAARRSEQQMNINNVEICVDTVGDPTHPAILLIHGSGASLDWWEDEFCERLAAGGRFVIRYDHRDTGQSVAYEPGKPGYTGDDLVADAAGVIDAVAAGSAHVVGISMGGALAQVLALTYPDRVDSLTLVSTSAGAGDADLPGVDERLATAFSLPRPEISDREALLDYLTELSRAYAGRRFDAAGTRSLWERALARARNVESMLTNHDHVEGGEAWRHRLNEIAVPVLVIHGTDDPLFPHPHGVALANELPDAELLTLDGVGHELPAYTWDEVVPAILAQTR
jgi:pimeloyl-ACP methyl ester carboxylesterase